MKEELEKIIGGTKQFIKSKVSVGILAAGLALGYTGCVASRLVGVYSSRASAEDKSCPGGLKCECMYDGATGKKGFVYCVDSDLVYGVTDQHKCETFCQEKK